MIRKLKLSAVCTQPTPTIHCIQFDTDRQIELCFEDIELAGLQEARIYGKKPDGTEFYNDCTIEDGKLIAPLTSQALAVKGIVPCQIQLVFGGTLTTYTFNVVVDDSLVSESAIESSNEYTALENALAEVEEIIGEIGDGIVKSVNGLKNDISLVDGDSTTVTTDTENGEIAVNVAADNSLSDTSENPVQNKIIKSELDGKLDLTGGTISGILTISGANNRLTFANSGNPCIIAGGHRIAQVGNPTAVTDAANRQYVDTQDALNEKLANKATTLENADNVKYPTTLAVKNAIEAIPASPATRYKLCVLKANWSNFGFAYSQREDGAYMDCDFEIPIGVINNNVYTPKTNPVFPLTYDAEGGHWDIDYALSFGKGSTTALYEQVEISTPFDKTEAELMEESELASVRISLLMKCDTIEEAQGIAEQFEQMKDKFTKVDFVYETFVEQTVEFEE